jgi:hypothetical protein
MLRLCLATKEAHQAASATNLGSSVQPSTVSPSIYLTAVHAYAHANAHARGREKEREGGGGHGGLGDQLRPKP